MRVEDQDFDERLQALAAQTERIKVLAEAIPHLRDRDEADEEIADLQRDAHKFALLNLIGILHQAAI
jgi:hypothetical protein